MGAPGLWRFLGYAGTLNRNSLLLRTSSDLAICAIVVRQATEYDADRRIIRTHLLQMESYHESYPLPGSTNYKRPVRKAPGAVSVPHATQGPRSLKAVLISLKVPSNVEMLVAGTQLLIVGCAGSSLALLAFVTRQLRTSIKNFWFCVGTLSLARIARYALLLYGYRVHNRRVTGGVPGMIRLTRCGRILVASTGAEQKF